MSFIDSRFVHDPEGKNVHDSINEHAAQLAEMATVNVDRFGAIGDGTIDDTLAVQSAVDYAYANKINLVKFTPNKTYVIDPAISLNAGIQLKSGVNIEIPATTIIQAKATNSQNYAIFKGQVVSNVKIFGGGTLKGERNSHIGTTGEWGMGVDFRGSTNIEIDGLRTQDFWGDGVYFTATGASQAGVCKNVSIRNVVSDNNRRQGISICGAEDVIIEHCIFSNTNGVAPSLGIDLEPDFANVTNKRVTIRNVKCINNHGSIASTSTEDVAIYDSFLGSDSTAVYTITGKNITLYNCKVEGTVYNVSNFKAYNCDFYKDSVTPNVYHFADDVSTPSDETITLKHCKIHTKDVQLFLYLQKTNSEMGRYQVDSCIFILDGNQTGDFGSPISLSANTLLTLINCSFLHTGANPANFWGISQYADGTKFRMISCYQDLIFSYNTSAGYVTKNTLVS